MNAVLASTKELLDVPAEATEFDFQLVLHINTALATLNQIISGPEPAYQITLEDGDLADLIPNDKATRNLVQMYIYAKVRLVFDPPTSSFVLTSLKENIAEYEWRLSDYKPIPTTQ
jgi:hypothetical protein